MQDYHWGYWFMYIVAGFLLSVISLHAQAPAIEFNNPSFEDPISQSWISTIHQSKDGFIWLGSTNGLIKFDGYTYLSFTHNSQDTQSLSNNWITEILEGPEGHLWIATDGGGLNEYIPEKGIFKSYRHQPDQETSISSDRIISGAYGSNGTIWLGTQSRGLNRMDLQTKTFTHYRHQAGKINCLIDDRVWAIWEDSLHATVWIGTPGGLDRLDLNSGKYTHYRNDPNDPHSLSINFVMSITPDSKGRIWVGTRIGLNRYDPNRDGFIRFMHNENDSYSLLNDYVFDVLEDSRQRIWIAALGGISLWNETNGSFFNYHSDLNKENALNSGTVWEVMEDNEGRLWIPTYGGGYSTIHLYQKKMDHFLLPYSNVSASAQSTIYKMIETSGDNIWIGSLSGLHHFNPKTKTFRYFHPNWIKAANWPIWGMTTTPENHLLIINQFGYLGFDPESEQFIPDYFQGQAPPVIPTGITADKNGNIWVFSNQTSELFRVDAQPPPGPFLHQ